MICVPCREVRGSSRGHWSWSGNSGESTTICPSCREPMRGMYYNWRAPKKNNTKAWAMIAAGDIWWDKKHVDKKARAAMVRWYKRIGRIKE